MAERILDVFMIPTTRGELRWKNEHWGVVLEERVYQDHGMPYITQTIRLPWSVLVEIEELSNA